MKNVNSTGIKMLSFILSAALTANAGWFLMGNSVSAAASIDVANSTVTLGSMKDYYIIDNGGLKASTSSTPGAGTEVSIANDYNFKLEKGAILAPRTDYVFGNIILSGDTGVNDRALLRFDSGHTHTINGGISGTGRCAIVNYSTLKMGACVISSMASNGLKEFTNGNHGIIDATIVSIDSDIYSDAAGSEIHVSGAFVKDDRDINSVVVAEPDAGIRSSGGTFTLKVGDAVKTITGAVNADAIDLLDDPGVTLGSIPSTVYVGTTYDFSNLISTASGYDGTAYLEYSSPAGVSYSTTQPTTYGSYMVRAYAPVSSSYRAGITEPQDFDIEYLPMSQVDSSGHYYTFSGVNNGVYVKDKLTVVPHEGFQISSNFTGLNNFSDSLELSESDLGGGNISTLSRIQFAFRRNSDGAMTNVIGVNDGINPSFRNLVFDSTDPVIGNASADGVGTSITDGCTIVADQLTFTVNDTYLDSASVNGSALSVNNGSASCTLTSTHLVPETVTVYAIDKSGREMNLSFTLRHTPIDPDTATVTVADSFVGDEYEPVINTNSDGDISVFYRILQSEGDLAEEEMYTDEKPTAAGNYEVNVFISGTDNYNEAFCYDTFTISKRTVEASVSVPDTYTGESYQPSVVTDSDGDISFSYRADGSELYTNDKPTAAGSYTVMAVIAETDTYNRIVCYGTFSILKRTATASISVSDSLVGDSYEPVYSSNSDGLSDAVIEYKPATAPDSAYTSAMPSAKGTYTVRITVPETYRYLGTSASSTFTISVRSASASVTVQDLYVGMDFEPVVTTVSDGSARAVFEYKAVSAPDDAYTTTKPINSGKYVVRATIPETAVYGEVVCTSEFNITFLPAPGNSYNMTGTPGNNDYFISDVALQAPEGYAIASSFRGEYGRSIPYSEDLNAIYLKRLSDGALTSAIALSVRPLIDKENPSLTTSTGSLADGSAMFINSLLVKASDDNLSSLTVNGEPVDLETAGSILTLSPGNGTMVFKIIAIDIAGNEQAVEITLMAEWLEGRVIPADLLLPLQAGEEYSLGDGNWTVSGADGDDSTVYNGGIPVYVNNSGDYTFTNAN